MDPYEALSEFHDQMDETVSDEPDDDPYSPNFGLCKVCRDPLLHDADIEAGRHFFCEDEVEEGNDG